MTLYKTTITPKSNFTTPLKGDTLFGQICWAIRYRLGEDRLNELLSDYDKKPFCKAEILKMLKQAKRSAMS